MFVCNECLHTHFKNAESFLSKSHGLCEYCNQPKVCNDIPSKHLVLKKPS